MFPKTAALAVVAAAGLAFGLGAGAQAQYGQGAPKPDAPKASTAPSATPQPGELKKAPEKVVTVSGKITSIAAKSLIVQVSGKTPKKYTFDLTGATIKAGVKQAAVTDLKEGDTVRVSYTEVEGKLTAKTVTAAKATK